MEHAPPLEPLDRPEPRDSEEGDCWGLWHSVLERGFVKVDFDGRDVGSDGGDGVEIDEVGEGDGTEAEEAVHFGRKRKKC